MNEQASEQKEPRVHEARVMLAHGCSEPWEGRWGGGDDQENKMKRKNANRLRSLLSTAA